MTYDKQIRNILRTIAVLLCIVIVCLVYLMVPHKQRVIWPEEVAAMSRDKNHPDTTTTYFDTVENTYHVDYTYFKK